MFIIMYFFFIRPQQKKQKPKNSAKPFKKATVVTIGGIHGKVVEVAHSTLVISVECKLRISKSAVSPNGGNELEVEVRK